LTKKPDEFDNNKIAFYNSGLKVNNSLKNMPILLGSYLFWSQCPSFFVLSCGYRAK
jgi:hypothetical protein